MSGGKVAFDSELIAEYLDDYAECIFDDCTAKIESVREQAKLIRAADTDLAAAIARAEAAERDAATLAKFAKTAPGRLPSLVQEAIARVDAIAAQQAEGEDRG